MQGERRMSRAHRKIAMIAHINDRTVECDVVDESMGGVGIVLHQYVPNVRVGDAINITRNVEKRYNVVVPDFYKKITGGKFLVVAISGLRLSCRRG